MFIFNNESELKGGSLPEAGCGPPRRAPNRGIAHQSVCSCPLPGAAWGLLCAGLAGNDLSLSLPSGWAERRRDGCFETEQSWHLVKIHSSAPVWCVGFRRWMCTVLGRVS